MNANTCTCGHDRGRHRDGSWYCNVCPCRKYFGRIGQWHHLRRGARRGSGFPVVVAGGAAPDLPLTPEGAPEIVRAAIRENIPLVIDLYDRNLSKADWRRIVQACFRALLYENSGVRHVFLEETAEFAPQKVLDGATYAEVEKLVRMGGNASVGVTLINQRAQEVNKAVLDLCENLFLMRQRGSHAIDALTKWLDKLSPEQAREIASSMPGMGPGDVWIFRGDADATPVRSRSGGLRSFHPDRKRPDLTEPGKPADTSEFVARLSGQLETLVEKAKENDPKHLHARIRDLERQLANADEGGRLAAFQKELDQQDARGRALEKHGQELSGMLDHIAGCNMAAIDTLRSVANALEGVVDVTKKQPKGPAVVYQFRRPTTPAAESAPEQKPSSAPHRSRKPSPAGDKNGAMPRGAARMLEALGFWRCLGVHEPSNKAVAAIMGIKPVGGNFSGPRRWLLLEGLIQYGDGTTTLTRPNGERAAGAMLELETEPSTLAELHERVLAALDRQPRARAMLNALLAAYPRGLTNAELAAAAELPSAVGGNFSEPRALLRKHGFSTGSKGQNVAADFLFPEGLQ